MEFLNNNSDSVTRLIQNIKELQNKFSFMHWNLNLNNLTIRDNNILLNNFSESRLNLDLLGYNVIYWEQPNI